MSRELREYERRRALMDLVDGGWWVTALAEVCGLTRAGLQTRLRNMERPTRKAEQLLRAKREEHARRQKLRRAEARFLAKAEARVRARAGSRG